MKNIGKSQDKNIYLIDLVIENLIISVADDNSVTSSEEF